MKLRNYSYEQIAKIICGDLKDDQGIVGIYLFGPKIVDFLCELGLDKTYENFGTRYFELSEGIKTLFDQNKYNDLFTNYFNLLNVNLIAKDKIEKIFEMINQI